MTGARKSALLVTMVAATVLSLGGVSWGQVYHQYPGAPVVGDTQPATGAAVAFGDNLLRLAGYGRFNASEVSDFGLEIVLDHLDSNGWRIGAAANYKHAIIPTDHNLAFDLSVTGGLGIETGADITNVDIPVGAIFSRPLQLKDNRLMVPFAALYLVYSHVSIDMPPGAGDSSEDNLDLELRLGSSMEITRGISAFASAHFGGTGLFALGINASL